MIFQRGNPMDYERWAGRPGHGDLGLPALPALLQADGDLPRRRQPAPTRGAAAAGRWSSSAARPTNPLFGAFFEAGAAGRLPADRRRQRLPAGGLRAASTATSHRGRRLSAARAYLHPVMDRPNLRVETLALATGVTLRRASAPSVSTTCAAAALHRVGRRRRGDPVRRRDQHPAAAAALRHRRPRATSSRSACAWCTTCPGWGRTSRTTSRSTSSTPPSSRSRSRPGSRWRKPARDRLRLALPPHAASAPPTTSRAAASPAATRTSTGRT